MIPVKDKRRIWAADFGRGYFQTPVHSPSLIAGLGVVFAVMLGVAVVAAASAAIVEDGGAALAIVPNVALVEARKKLEEKQKALEKVFEEAKTDAGELDFRNVKCLGEGLTTAAIAEKVRDMNAELNDLYDECAKLADAEKGGETLDRIRKMKHPEPGDPEAKEAAKSIKSLGELVSEDERYVDHFVKCHAGGGITLNLEDAYPSDLLARGRQFKTLMSTAAGWAPESIRIPGLVVPAVTRPVQLLDIIPMGRTGMEQIVYMEETTRTHGADEKSEGASFAESAFVLEEKTSNVRKITDSLPVTDEQLEDVEMIGGYINGRLTFGLRQRLDAQALIGDGAAPNLRGIKNVTGILTQAKGEDPVPDAFFKAMRKIRVTGRAMPTHHLIHPEDWEKVRLLRTADGVYVWGNPSEAGPERLWGLPVVQTDVGAAGTGYTGSFEPQWISLFERRGVDVQVGYTGSQFTEGKRTIRADMRYALAVFRPAAFASVTGL